MKLYLLCNQIFVLERVPVTIDERNDADRGETKEISARGPLKDESGADV